MGYWTEANTNIQHGSPKMSYQQKHIPKAALSYG